MPVRLPFTRPRKPTRTRRFDAAAHGRRWPDARESFGRTASETTAAAPVIRGQARHAVANDALLSNGVDNLVTGLVGSGVRSVSAHPDAATREAIGKAFERWCARADFDCRTDGFGLQAQIARALIVDGECFVVIAHEANGPTLRVLPAEFVDEGETRELGGGSRTVAGVELDADGRRVAYHVLRAHPSDPFASAAGSVRIPADRVLHVMRPLGAGQVRGVSWLAPVLLPARELSALRDALLMGSKIAAMHCGVIVDMNGTGGDLPFDGEQDGSVLESGLEPGTLRYLPGGMDVRWSSPQQAQQTAEFMAAEVRAIAAGLGVPAHLLDGDLRSANYSSLRAAMVAFRQRLEAVQFGVLVPQLLRPVWETVVTSLVLSGELDAPGFESNRAAYLAAEFYPPAFPWVDPAKDIAATKDAIAAGLLSRRQAVAERGYAVEAVDAEIAADRQRESALDLDFSGAAP